VDALLLNLDKIVNSFNSELPIYFQNLIVLICGLIIAKLIYIATAGLLKILQFDLLAEKIGLLDFLGKHINDIPSRIIGQILYWLIITITLCLIVDNFGFVDISRTLWTIITLISQLLAFAAFLIINFYILKFLASILNITLSIINFQYYKVVEIFILIVGGWGVVYYSLPIINFNEDVFLNGTIFFLKTLLISAALITIIGCRNLVYTIYLHFLIKSNFKIGNHIVISGEKFVINKINLFSVVLLSKEAEITFDNIKFYEHIIKKR